MTAKSLLIAVAIIATATPALAQRTDNNAVTSAEDAFGKAEPLGFDLRFCVFRSIGDTERSHSDLLFGTD